MMNAKLIGQNEVVQFVVEMDGVKYNARIYLNEKGRFIDEQISYNSSGEELDYEGTEGDIRERITDYLDENWDTLVGVRLIGGTS